MIHYICSGGVLPTINDGFRGVLLLPPLLTRCRSRTAADTCSDDVFVGGVSGAALGGGKSASSGPETSPLS